MSQVRSAGTRRLTPLPACTLAMLVIVCVTGAPMATATTVYRSVDAEGRVVFSDTPPGPGERAEAVEIQAPATFEAPPTSTPDSGANWEWDMRAQDDLEPATFDYAAAVILAPANDETVRENSGTVTIVAGIEPELRPGHQIEVLMDGQVLATTGGNQVTLTEVDRGTHTLQVRVIDDAGAALIEGPPSTFHLLRYAPLLAPNRPPPKPVPPPAPRGN